MSDARHHLRWGSSLAVVLALHGVAGMAMVGWRSTAAAAAPPPAAIMIELAPAPVAPPAPAPTEKPVEEPKPKPPEPKPQKPMPVKKAEVALERKERPPEPPRQEESSAPPSVAAPPSEVAAAPAQGASPTPPSNALPTWQGALLAHLERHKRYPAGAQARRQQGVAHVAVTIDRQGRVIAKRLQRGSGYDSLDQETLDLLTRAQPLPPPPAEIAGAQIDLVVPVQFYLR